MTLGSPIWVIGGVFEKDIIRLVRQIFDISGGFGCEMEVFSNNFL